MPLRPAEEMARCVSIGEHDIAHLVAALEHPDRALKEALGEVGVNDIRRIVAEHFSHILSEDFRLALRVGRRSSSELENPFFRFLERSPRFPLLAIMRVAKRYSPIACRRPNRV